MLRNSRKRPAAAWLAWVAMAAVLAVAADSSGQVIRRQFGPARILAEPAKPHSKDKPAEEDAAENVFLPANRETLKKLSETRVLLAEERYGEAVRNLGTILETPEDFFFLPDKKSPKPSGLKAEAERMIGRMPKEGRDLYELQYGARARQLLNEAVDAGDAEKLSEVSRRFFHTQSGYQATFLLGLDDFDRGRPAAGALTLQRLYDAGHAREPFEPALSLSLAACRLQAGMTEQSRQILVALRERHPTIRVKVAGREVPLFVKNAEAVDWLKRLLAAQPSASLASLADNWLMYRGDAARCAPAVGDAPLLNMQWRVPATSDPSMANRLEQFRKAYAERGSAVMPAFHPLVVGGDVLLMRTIRNLLAVDFATGKRLWEVPVDDPPERAMGASEEDAQGPQAAQQAARQALQATAAAGARLWSDMTYGTLSSDGRSVFSVEDAELKSGTSAMRGAMAIQGQFVFNGMGGVARNGESSLNNCLAARDIRTGKLRWQIGGSAGLRALRQPETFFLGPPLPLMGRLFALAEVKGEIRLLTLDADTGELVWSQQLASADPGVAQYPQRRIVGASPSYADGILVCPTSAGAVVGIDLATRLLAWGYCFDRGPGERASRRNAIQMMMWANSYGEPSSEGWLDDSVSIGAGRVLATPPGFNWLYCLNLNDGELLWKCARGENLFVACIAGDNVVLVGRETVSAVRLSDGKPAWNDHAVELPKNAPPSGRGFLSGGRYYLPLSNAEVVGIDVSSGKIVQTARSRKGIVPGNLVCSRGKIVSQGMEGVDAFYQLGMASAEVERRLAANPNDAEALSLRGEILLDGDRRAEAVAAFRRAYELNSSPRTRELLRDALLDGLRTEFAVYRDRVPEIERLLDDSTQRATLLRSMGAGLRQTGESTAAFECYRKLLDLEPGERPLDSIEPSLVVRRDRWVRSQLAALRREATPASAAEIDAAIATRMQSVLAGRSLERLRWFVDCFGQQPAAGPARDELVRRLGAVGRLLDAELTSAAPSPTAKPDKPAIAWPTGVVEAATGPTKGLQGNAYGHCALEVRGNPEPFFRDTTLQFDYTRRAIVAYDALGKMQWQVSLVDRRKQNQDFSFNMATTYGRVQGHLLLVSLGWKIMAIDTLGVKPKGEPRVLWTQDLNASAADSDDPMFVAQLVGIPWLAQRRFMRARDQSNVLGLCRREYVCFQRFGNLVAVDPRNGETLWVRRDLPSNCTLFGDDEHVFAVPSDSDEAMVFLACDGSSAGTRRVPRGSSRQLLPNGDWKEVFGAWEERCLASLGRNLLLWWPDGNQRTLTLVDPFEGRDLWPGHKFAAGAQACVVGEEMVAVMEPSGRFLLISLADGRTISELKLEAEPALQEIDFIESGDRYFLLTRSMPHNGNLPPIQPMPGGGQFNPIYQGRLYAIDRQGKPMWPAPAKIRNQILLSGQPTGLPVLAFACQVYEQKLFGLGGGQYNTSVLCIDKRTGKTAYQKIFSKSAGVFHVAGDPKKKTVDLTMQNNTITLTFTDKVVPPPSAAAKPTKSASGSKTARALWNSIQNILGKDGEETDENDPFAP